MIVEIDRKKLAETFENTIDPNFLYEEILRDDIHDHDGDQHHDHVHNVVEPIPQNNQGAEA